jgi:hypothetical protein
MSASAKDIPGYSYGLPEVATSAVTLEELNQLKVTAGFTEADQRFLRLAGEVLSDQTQQIVDLWRSCIIASIPHLAKHSQTLARQAISAYLASSDLRFRQWILDTCLRAYDQEWLDYQHRSAPHDPEEEHEGWSSVHTFRAPRACDRICRSHERDDQAFSVRQGTSADEVEAMHQAWCKSMQLQLALWVRAYAEACRGIPRSQ